MIARLPDWRARLRAYLEAVARASFRPGAHDCALFVAGGIEAMTGEDLAADWRGSYRSLKAGRAKLAEQGCPDLASLAAARFEEVPAIFAQEGDVAILRDARGDHAFGLVQGALIYVLRKDGLGLVPLTDAERAFRI